jgi:hypothetical protein
VKRGMEAILRAIHRPGVAIKGKKEGKIEEGEQ